MHQTRLNVKHVALQAILMLKIAIFEKGVLKTPRLQLTDFLPRVTYVELKLLIP